MGNQPQRNVEATEPHGLKTAGADSHIHKFHLELPWHHLPHSHNTQFDAKKSVSQLLGEGKMVNAMAGSKNHPGAGTAETRLAAAGADGSQKHADYHSKPGAVPKVKVVFEEESHDPKKPGRQPDFVVTKAGKVEVHNDCEKTPNPDGQILIRVAREHNQMNPSAAETKSLDHLISYLDGRVEASHPEVKKQKLEVADDQGLVDKHVMHRVARPDNWHLPEQTTHQIQRVNRFNGGEGTMNRQQIDHYFTRRDVPQQSNEGPGVVAMKDAVASLFSPDAQKPYDTVRQRYDGGFSVGRYGLNESLISGWFNQLLGNPPDWNKIDELVAEGKLSKELAKNLHDPQFRQEFGQFVEKMKGGQGAVTQADLEKFLPKELQEQIATDTIKRFNAAGERSPGRIALAMAIGTSPDKLTAQQLADQGCQQFMGAADRLFGLAQARQMMGQHDQIEWSGVSPMGSRIAQVAENTARNMGTIGWCARGVETALGKLGIHFSGNAADTRSFFEHDGRFQRVSMNDLQAGDVVVRGASGSHQYGHIFVYLGAGREASDHVQNLTNGASYGQSVAFRYVGDQPRNA